MDRHGALQSSSSSSAGEIQQRPPLIPSERNNNNNNGGVIIRRNSRSTTREVSSRYKSPVPPSSPSVPRRFPSPNLTRTPTISSVPKRAHSVERKRPCTPPSPPSPSTPPIHDSCSGADVQKRTGSGRVPDSLWPSTMRSLSVSFQSDSISIPSKRENKKPVVTRDLSDRTLKPSSNVAHRRPESPPVALLRKPTPERKRSPLKGKNVSDQSENFKPVDSLHSRLVDQHRWPSRTGGKISSDAMSKSVDLNNLNSRTSASISGRGLSSMRRAPASDGLSKPLQKSTSDAASLLTTQLEAYSAEVNSRWLSGLHKPLPSSSLERVNFRNSAVRSQSLPVPGSRPASPSKASVVASSKGVGPSRARPATPPSRGTSPSRIRPTTVTSSQSSSSTSVLSYIADYRKGKKGSNQLEDAHQLRLLYNRHLQWRFTNARANDALYMQSVIAEEGLYNVGRTISDLWDLVIKKRINLQQLKLELKLNAALNNQMTYLDDWALLERDHGDSLSGVIEDLEASTLRLPVTVGAKADIENVKAAICSAVDVVQAMGSYLCSLHSRVEGRNSLVSELADVVTLERAMLGECEALLASTAAMQVEEYSVRSQLIQFNHDLRKD